MLRPIDIMSISDALLVHEAKLIGERFFDITQFLQVTEFSKIYVPSDFIMEQFLEKYGYTMQQVFEQIEILHPLFDGIFHPFKVDVDIYTTFQVDLPEIGQIKHTGAVEVNIIDGILMTPTSSKTVDVWLKTPRLNIVPLINLTPIDREEWRIENVQDLRLEKRNMEKMILGNLPQKPLYLLLERDRYQDLPPFRLKIDKNSRIFDVLIKIFDFYTAQLVKSDLEKLLKELPEGSMSYDLIEDYLEGINAGEYRSVSLWKLVPRFIEYFELHDDTVVINYGS
jgi:hypothetical protein